MSRTVTIVNTDPQRRCYNGCNFSERTDYGPWEEFGVYEQREWAEATVKSLACGRYEYKIEERS